MAQSGPDSCVTQIYHRRDHTIASLRIESHTKGILTDKRGLESLDLRQDKIESR